MPQSGGPRSSNIAFWEIPEYNIGSESDLLAAPSPTSTDPKYKAQTIGLRKDRINTLQTKTEWCIQMTVKISAVYITSIIQIKIMHN